jgi:hypothetical protein
LTLFHDHTKADGIKGIVREKSMSTKGNRENDITALDKLIDEITIDAYGDDEKLWAFRQAFEDDVNLPADGFVIGEPVSVVEIDYDGNDALAQSV